MPFFSFCRLDAQLQGIEKSRQEREGYQSRLYEHERDVLQKERESYQRLRNDIAEQLTEEEKKLIGAHDEELTRLMVERERQLWRYDIQCRGEARSNAKQESDAQFRTLAELNVLSRATEEIERLEEQERQRFRRVFANQPVSAERFRPPQPTSASRRSSTTSRTTISSLSTESNVPDSSRRSSIQSHPVEEPSSYTQSSYSSKRTSPSTVTSASVSSSSPPTSPTTSDIERSLYSPLPIIPPTVRPSSQLLSPSLPILHHSLSLDEWQRQLEVHNQELQQKRQQLKQQQVCHILQWIFII